MKLELYHFGFSTCSQKVRLVLAEKGLEFASHEVNLMTGEQHDLAYVKLNPAHVVPTLVKDGRVYTESTLIIRYLDDLRAEPALRPTSADARYRDERWLRRFDDEIHPAAPILTFALGPRQAILAQPEDVREANIEGIPDPAARAIRRSVLEHGVHAPEFGRALGVFLDMLDDMEADLDASPWLAGDAPGLADATALPYVLRMEHLALDPLVAARPGVLGWLGRFKARESYAIAVDAWAPPAVVEVMRKNGEASWPEVDAVAARHRAA